jgi:hypothetical protein
MRDWLALRGPLAMAACLAAALLGTRALVASDGAVFAVPSPEQTAEKFLRALHTHDYGAARHALTRTLQARVTIGDLRALARELERTRPRLEDAQGLSSAVRGWVASAAVELRRGDGRRDRAEFRLEREHGLWKLASIEPARALARTLAGPQVRSSPPTPGGDGG